MKKFLKMCGGLIALFLIGGLLWLRTPAGPRINKAEIRQQAQSYDVRIIRDQWGVPHIFGKTDADAAFGLGYAHAEDDWPTIQETLISARGIAAQHKGKAVAPSDYLYDLFKVREAVEAKYDTDISQQTRDIAEGYAKALNLYAIDNPDDTLPGLLPITGHNVIAGFTWATPFFFRMDGILTELFSAEDRPDISPYSQQQAELNLPEAVRGSNGFAVAPKRSTDGHTRLIVNSHQPMTGPYAWYEAHTVSEEGLNLAGAGFPGTPILTQGITPTHGWTQTVNRPDLIDIYALDVDNEKKPKRYKLDGEWREFERSKSKFRVKLWGPFSLPITRDVLWSEHGPVIDAPTGFYAMRFAGLQEVKALEQWHQMGKATNLDEWLVALDINGVLSFNMVYADKDGNIAHFYNAKMPNRIEGPDWLKALPGNRSELIWREYRSPRDLPRLINPESGWVFSANSHPFMITDTEHNLKREDFSPTFGIEPRVTNRARRAMAQLEPDEAISREELLTYRADTFYHPESIIRQNIANILEQDYDDPLLQQAQEVLRDWDGDTAQSSRGAALAVISGTRALGYEYIENVSALETALKETTQDLMAAFGRLDPEWGQVNRLQRGNVDLPLDGGPDILRAIYSDRDGVRKNGTLNAFAGDTHIMVADWDAEGNVIVDSVHQYGAATLDVSSPHYADQAPLFARGEYKKMPMTLEEVLPHATRDYRPGQP